MDTILLYLLLSKIVRNSFTVDTGLNDVLVHVMYKRINAYVEQSEFYLFTNTYTVHSVSPYLQKDA